MRVAIFAVMLLGIGLGRASHAQVLQGADGTAFSGTVPTVAMNNSAFSVPELTNPAVTRAKLRRGVRGRGATVPAQSTPALRTPTLAASTLALGVGSPRSLDTGAYQPALHAPDHPTRTFTDHLLAGAVGLMLIAYQLRRKHRVLRPHPFTT